MKFEFRNGEYLEVKEYKEIDFPHIYQLIKEENWNNLVSKETLTKQAWDNSNITFCVWKDNILVGYIRGLTDYSITLFICELLISKQYRGLGIAKFLIQYVHNLYPTTRLDLLATSTSKDFYKKNGFREFYGYRKT
ncbi:GNAT family N-acetyltransferase [Sutcliffiella horikoshii]|uniref:GNAT family N-acetyltransferase n=1 Tax=Sutcliffiella horikoshii TaxID=79883 RepID=UPI003CEC8EE9